MNPIPLTVFATLAGLSLASLALLRRWDEHQPGLAIAIRFLFMAFLFSILGLVGSAVLRNIRNFFFMPEDAQSMIHTVDNIFTLACLFFASAYIWSGAGYLVAYKSGKEGTVFKYLFEKYGYILSWLLISLTAYYFLGIRYQIYWVLILFLSVLVLSFIFLFTCRNAIIQQIFRGILLIRPFNYISGKSIDFFYCLLHKVDNFLQAGFNQAPKNKDGA